MHKSGFVGKTSRLLNSCELNDSILNATPRKFKLRIAVRSRSTAHVAFAQTARAKHLGYEFENWRLASSGVDGSGARDRSAGAVFSFASVYRRKLTFGPRCGCGQDSQMSL